jgi:asparagine synthase (glutamine-hydrolysing)
MRDAMTHRGPDDAGVFTTADLDAGLVSCRLAIRDLSSAGHMPMSNDEGDVILTYNGEIYNADELRADLESRGFRFRSRTDSEVILHGYEAWGVSVVSRLRGMFAFAILDLRPSAPKLLLARDRLGIKPLYYRVGPDGIAFASELRALLDASLLEPVVDPLSIALFLLLGSVPEPWTIFEGARALPPATTLVVDATGSVIDTYWRFPEPGSAGERQEVVAHVRELLRDAVQRHLVSDVPLGVFLSGGVDSGVVTAMMHNAGAEVLRSCSISFPGTAYDESAIARLVAEAYGAEHFEEAITAEDLRSELPAIVAAMDQPTVDGVNTYFVSRTARRAGLTVAMSGLGGDELFGGYDTFDRLPRLLKRLRIASFPGGATVGRLGARLIGSHAAAKAADALTREPTPASAYLALRGLFSPSEVAGLIGDERTTEAMAEIDVLAMIDRNTGVGEEPTRDLYSWVSRAELSNYMRNQLLRDTDVMSMRHSLEVRVPLLDDRLVEGVLALPTQVKTGPGNKPLLLDAVADLVPAELRSARRKRGFTFPFETWLGNELHDLVALALDPEAVGELGWMDPTAVGNVLLGFQRGRVHWSRVWSLVVLQLWLRSVRDPRSPLTYSAA